MAEYIGYTALAISLLSVSMSNFLTFRYLHLLSSSVYLVYGLLIEALPLAMGSAIFMMIHTYRLYKYYKLKV